MPERVDAREKWLVLFIFCLVTWLDFGLIFAFGAMFVSMMEKFNSDRSTTAIVQSLLVGVSLSFSVVSGALVSKFGLLTVTLVSSILVPLGFCVSYFINTVWLLYITISIISGVGISTLHLVNIVVIEQHFPRRQHPLCFAIQGVGVNLAGVVYPLLIEKLLINYGVNGTFLVLGGITLNSCVASWFLFLKHKLSDATNHTNRQGEKTAMIPEDNDEENMYKDNKEQLDTDTAVRVRSSLFTRIYMVLLVASALSIPSVNTFLGLTVDIFVWKGFSVSQGLFSFVPFNIISIVSKFIPVLAKKVRGVSSFSLPILFCMCGLLGQILVYFSSSYVLMLVGTGFAGLSQGGFPALLIAAVKIVRPEEWPVASGLLVTIIGITTAVLGPAFGFLMDLTGSYSSAVVIMAVQQTLGAILYLMALLFRRSMKKSAQDNT